jgi:hypothetical protein
LLVLPNVAGAVWCNAMRWNAVWGCGAVGCGAMWCGNGALQCGGVFCGGGGAMQCGAKGVVWMWRARESGGGEW